MGCAKCGYKKLLHKPREWERKLGYRHWYSMNHGKILCKNCYELYQEKHRELDKEFHLLTNGGK